MNSTEPTSTWTKGRKGDWLVRIPKELWDNYREAGENEVAVTKRNGDKQWVAIADTSKPFTFNGVEYVLGTPVKETRTHRRRTNTPRRCEECSSTRHVHKAKDMSGLNCWLCDKCDDGAASIC